jgi:nondiscriminating aspartyl-tRNA synthetase
MSKPFSSRTLTAEIPAAIGQRVLLRGWVYRLRELATTTFVVVRDVSGEAQCVIGSSRFREFAIKVDDAVEVVGTVRSDPRAKLGCEVDAEQIVVLNPATDKLPFNSSSDIEAVGAEALLEYRPPPHATIASATCSVCKPRCSRAFASSCRSGGSRRS